MELKSYYVFLGGDSVVEIRNVQVQRRLDLVTSEEIIAFVGTDGLKAQFAMANICGWGERPNTIPWLLYKVK